MPIVREKGVIEYGRKSTAKKIPDFRELSDFNTKSSGLRFETDLLLYVCG